MFCGYRTEQFRGNHGDAGGDYGEDADEGV
jgi:hypothetical protein